MIEYATFRKGKASTGWSTLLQRFDYTLYFTFTVAFPGSASRLFPTLSSIAHGLAFLSLWLNVTIVFHVAFFLTLTVQT